MKRFTLVKYIIINVYIKKDNFKVHTAYAYLPLIVTSIANRIYELRNIRVCIVRSHYKHVLQNIVVNHKKKKNKTFSTFPWNNNKNKIFKVYIHPRRCTTRQLLHSKKKKNYGSNLKWYRKKENKYLSGLREYLIQVPNTG